MLMNNKIFSIIIPNYNSGYKLENTIKSIINQKRDLYELIIIDGGSTDCCIDIIDKYKFFIDKCIINKDNGIYDAMNKGIKIASGKYLYFIGAGDILQENILYEISEIIPKNGVNFIYGNVLYNGKKYNGRYNKLKLLRNNICHQAIFYSYEIFSVVGLYDLKYKILSDYVLNIKCFGKQEINKIYLNKIIANYEGNGISVKKIDNEFLNDYLMIIKENFNYFLYLLALIKNIVKKILK